MAGEGDKLARGAHKAAFPPAGGNVSADKWAEMWQDFDPEAYKASKPEAGSGEKETVRTGIVTSAQPEPEVV